MSTEPPAGPERLRFFPGEPGRLAGRRTRVASGSRGEAEPGERPSRARLDLAFYSEAARQAIYDFVIAEYFTRKEVHGVEWDSLYEPGEAQLQVHFLFGRWLVTWWSQTEHEKLPERARRELLLVEQDERGKILLREI